MLDAHKGQPSAPWAWPRWNILVATERGGGVWATMVREEQWLLVPGEVGTLSFPCSPSSRGQCLWQLQWQCHVRLLYYYTIYNLFILLFYYYYLYYSISTSFLVQMQILLLRVLRDCRVHSNHHSNHHSNDKQRCSPPIFWRDLKKYSW